MTKTSGENDVWNDAMLVDPHTVADKRSRVQKMFAAIAPSYDLNNRLHTLWLDQSWRKRAVKLAKVAAGETILDIACGTGDLTLAFLKRLRRFGDVRAGQIIGLDFTFEMLPLARLKTPGEPIVWINGDAQMLPLPDGCCDVVSIAFGLRNVVDPAAALREFFRVLRLGGRVMILEFSLPTNPIFRGFYNFYFKQILPRTATWISGDRTGAYKYLPQSVRTFIDRATIMAMMESAGFAEVKQNPMTLGICVGYLGVKQ